MIVQVGMMLPDDCGNHKGTLSEDIRHLLRNEEEEDMIDEMYDPSSNSLANIDTNRPIPREPTKYLPGTEAKIQVMRRRYFNGEQLYHPLDAKW